MVFDIQDRLVQSFQNENSSTINLNLELQTGIYTAEIITAEKKMFAKIIIK